MMLFLKYFSFLIFLFLNFGGNLIVFENSESRFGQSAFSVQNTVFASDSRTSDIQASSNNSINSDNLRTINNPDNSKKSDNLDNNVKSDNLSNADSSINSGHPAQSDRQNSSDSVSSSSKKWKKMLTFYFEIGMLVCFGMSWPFSIYKVWKTQKVEGKSYIFLFLILTGYTFGILHKIFGTFDAVIYLYLFLFALVLIDLIQAKIIEHRNIQEADELLTLSQKRWKKENPSLFGHRKKRSSSNNSESEKINRSKDSSSNSKGSSSDSRAIDSQSSSSKGSNSDTKHSRSNSKLASQKSSDNSKADCSETADPKNTSSKKHNRPNTEHLERCPEKHSEKHSESAENFRHQNHSEHSEQSKLFKQSEHLKHSDSSHSSNHTEHSEHSKHSEQSEHSKQQKQSEHSEHSKHLKHKESVLENDVKRHSADHPQEHLKMLVQNDLGHHSEKILEKSEFSPQSKEETDNFNLYFSE